jgi:hypothetical protein
MLLTHVQEMSLQVDLQTQCSTHSRLSVERLCTGITNVNVGAILEYTNLDKCLQPLLNVTAECASELLVRQQAADSDTSILVLALVQLPACAVQVVDGSLGTSSPANGQLTTGVLEPQHQLLGLGGGRVTLGIRGHEIEADVTLVGGSVGTLPVVGRGDRLDSGQLSLKVLGQADEGVALGNVVAMVCQPIRS